MIHFFLVLLSGIGTGSCESRAPHAFLASPASSALNFTIASCSLTGNGTSKNCTVTATGGFTITQIKVNDTILTAGVDYEILEGSDGTSKVKIRFTTPPASGASVTITGTGNNSNPNPSATWD
jgi:hypothetical protein